MSFPLHTKGTAWGNLDGPVLGRITTTPTEPAARADHVLIAHHFGEGGDLRGYAGILTTERLSPDRLSALDVGEMPVIHGVAYLHHVEDGDVVALNPGGYVRTLYRTSSPFNALFATDRCNSFCLMCSQPPKRVDDSDRVSEHLRLLDLIDPGIRELGITGGEPTLLKDDLIRIVQRARERLPETALHILSNGRLFYYGSFARRLASVGHPDLVVGVPLYSDIDWQHDFVVQARGAFEETMVGLQNLGRHDVKVEIRVVLHRLTYRRLPALAEFIYRNLCFAVHVAWMGLEPIGFAVPNLEELWIDPHDYQRELEEATLFLAARGMNISIYNHQLCVVPRALWPFCRKAISDWKNDYLEECDGCVVRDRCGGFFSSALRRRQSGYIQAIRSEPSVDVSNVGP